MLVVEVLLTSPLVGGLEPLSHDMLMVRFHRLVRTSELPLLDGAVWAFVDWLLPDMAGVELCRRLRCDPLTSQAHITMVLPETDQELARQALRAGADDYLTGPLTRTMALDRIFASNLAHSSALPGGRTIGAGGLTLDTAAFQARWEGTVIPLKPNELRLLRFLLEHRGRVFTRHQLIAALGKDGAGIDERTVDVWIGRLRRALEQAGATGLLRTVRSLGYILDV